MKKGDIVKITETGSIYPSYKDMAEKLGADIDGKWKNLRTGGGRWIRDTKAEVLNIHITNRGTGHGYNHVLIEIIEGVCLGEQYIIGDDGIEIDIVSEILDADLFDI